jgi:hypothetical protein
MPEITEPNLKYGKLNRLISTDKANYEAFRRKPKNLSHLNAIN